MKRSAVESMEEPRSEIAERIIRLRNADLDLRARLLATGKLNEGYHPEMEELHCSNALILEGIVDRIGYPTAGKVGKEASDAAWLVMQHAIGLPRFMKKCLDLLERAVSAGEANGILWAYLSDRIAVFEGRPQRFGTQFDWDEEGQLSPNPVDDPAQVDRRRRSLHMNTLAEQTAIMRQRAKEEGQTPPADLTRWRREAENWKRSVGWLPE